MTIVKRKKQRGSLLLRIAIFSFVVYTIAALVNQQIQISQKRQELAEARQQIQIQEIKNEDMKHALSTDAKASGDYMERVARESLHLAKPGERVFVNIAGN